MSRTFRRPSEDTHDRKACPQCQGNRPARQAPIPPDDDEGAPQLPVNNDE